MGGRSWLWDLVLLAVFTAFGPAMTVVNNNESPSLATAALTVLVAFVLGLLIRLVLVRAGLEPRGVTFSVALLLFSLMNGGSLVGSFPTGRMGVAAVTAVAGVVVYRLRENRIVQFLFSWACLALAVTPIVTAVGNADFSEGKPVAIGEEISTRRFVSTPDVVVIVADGYGSNQVLTELYGFGNFEFTRSLESVGTFLNPEMKSNYGWTKLSIPSLLQMGYLPVGTPTSPPVEAQLLEILGGDNRLVDVMVSNGYRTVYVESGWLGTQCSDKVDVCIPGPWPDETFYDIVYRSALRDLAGLETGISFSRGAQSAMAVLDKELRGFLEDDTPDFIYVHLLAPHPPLFLDETCEQNADLAVAGFTVGPPGSDDSEAAARRDAYIAQVQCVNTHLTAAVGVIAQTGAVGLLLGDHGPDQSGQLFTYSDSWSDEQKLERLSVLFAAHHPGCDYESVATLVNVGRRLVSCLADTELPLLPNRYFDLNRRQVLPTVIELDPPSGWAR